MKGLCLHQREGNNDSVFSDGLLSSLPGGYLSRPCAPGTSQRKWLGSAIHGNYPGVGQKGNANTDLCSVVCFVDTNWLLSESSTNEIHTLNFWGQFIEYNVFSIALDLLRPALALGDHPVNPNSFPAIVSHPSLGLSHLMGPGYPFHCKLVDRLMGENCLCSLAPEVSGV